MTGATWFGNYISVCIDDYDDFCDLTKVSVTNINLITIVF